MSVRIKDRDVFSLYEVTKSIQKTLLKRYSTSFWVQAEMNKLNYYKYSGHCYPELLEKKEGKVVATIRSNIWKANYNRINQAFIKILKEPLRDGIKILFLAKITFHPEYGLSLSIEDIDPSFTLGDLEREKQETISRLQKEGIFYKNKEKTIELLPQRIAIISVETSKGYADFLKVIDENSWNYKFFHLLFPSLLQGDKAIKSINDQLNNIKKVLNHFDVVAIIRGGGGDVGLSTFNDYKLAKAIALFPIPVLTGIGHATNETVTEMVSFSNAITPTKMAEYLIQKFHNFSVPVNKYQNKIIDKSQTFIIHENQKLQSVVKLFQYATNNIIQKNKSSLRDKGLKLIRLSSASFDKNLGFVNNLKVQLKNGVNSILISRDRDLYEVVNKSRHKLGYFFKLKETELANIEKNIKNMSPENVLKRGYSITLIDGKSIKNSKQVSKGDLLQTIVLEGEIMSEVK